MEKYSLCGRTFKTQSAMNEKARQTTEMIDSANLFPTIETYQGCVLVTYPSINIDRIGWSYTIVWSEDIPKNRRIDSACCMNGTKEAVREAGQKHIDSIVKQAV